MKSLITTCLLMLSNLAYGGESSSLPQKLFINNISWPEGPTWHQGELYYVAYGSGEIMRVREGQAETFWHKDGCGPTGLLSKPTGDLMVSCHDSNEILRVSSNGKTMETILHDSKFERFHGPNDFTIDASGGYYFTASAVFDPTAPIAGKIYYVSADGRVREVAKNIHYANGIALSPDGKTLLVAEHLAAQILAFTVMPDGKLQDRRVWKTLDELVAPLPGASATYGIGGIKIDSSGQVYITNYGAGRLLITNADGRLIHSVGVPALYIDNLALGEDGMLYITAVINETSAPYPGFLYAVPNPAFRPMTPAAQ